MRMKYIIASTAIAVIFLLPLQSGSQSRVPGGINTLSYVESSAGLTGLAWEGGRTEFEFADINLDGHVDFVSIGDHGNPLIQSDEQGVMVFLGDGMGSWNILMSGNFGYGGIAVGDVNNDGFPDIGYGMHHNYSSTDFGDQLTEVALGDGTGSGWTPWDDGLATSGEEWGMFATDFADVDNDGDLDLGNISFGCCAGIHVYLNHLDGSWTQSFGFISGNSDMIFQFGDFDNDGFMDFAAAHQDGTAYFGDGTGHFTLNDLGLPGSGSLGRAGISVGDADGDGGMDLSFVNSEGGVEVFVFSEMLERWTEYDAGLPSAGDFELTQMKDMNGDGLMDVSAFGNGTFQLWLGDGAGNWTADATFNVETPGYAQAFLAGGDIDHNGRPDMVMLFETGSWWSYINNLKCFKESSIAVLLGIRAAYPHGHEFLRPGSIRNVEWYSTVPGNAATPVTLEYSVTGADGPWILMASGLPNSGRYQWLVPAANSDNCYIMYSVSDGINTMTAITPSAFTISDGSLGITQDPEASRRNISLELEPNPSHGPVTFSLSLEPGNNAELEINDLAGRLVKSLSGSIDKSTGFQRISWDGTDDSRRSLKPGIYLARLQQGHSVAVKKVIRIE